MAWTQSDSDTFHRRLRNIARALIDADEEIERLLSLAASENLGANLHDAGDGSVTAAEAIALNGVVQSFSAWLDGNGTAEDTERRAKLDAYLADAVGGTTTG